MAYARRRLIIAVISLIGLGIVVWQAAPPIVELSSVQTEPLAETGNSILASEALDTLEVKGRAPKTGYSRDEFGSGWAKVTGCDTRNIILNRDLNDTEINEKCQVTKGVLHDSYTGNIIQFDRTNGSSVQIDHVVALSDAWQKGAQQLSREQRITLANDPLDLIAVDGPSNQEKADGDAATWLPPNKSFRCQYVARQIAVKQKYQLWVTQAEKTAMQTVLDTCPAQTLP